MSRVVFAALLCLAASAHAQARYFSAVEDLPLATGLTEAGRGIWFEDANGRILVVSAHGAVELDTVRHFYAETLPALGWSLSPGAGGEHEQVFFRGRERLALAISRRDGGALLEVQLFQQAPLMDAN